MKTSFSTVGCPNWMWSEIVSAAKDLGYDGVEIRGIGSDLYVPDVKIFSLKNIENTKNELKGLGLEIPCIASSCYLHLKDKDYMAEGKEYIDIAEAIGARNVRLLGDTEPHPSGNIDIPLVVSRLRELAEYAKNKNVTLLLETNGVFASSPVMLNVMRELNLPEVGVLWDVNHPLRYFGENITFTWKTLNKYIRHIHYKDSVIENGRIKYRMAGHGTFPTADLFHLLKKDGYEGYVSLEWVKRWNDELEDAGIVFSNFISTISPLIGKIGNR
jgi:fatty-acyl-CoA synthase